MGRDNAAAQTLVKKALASSKLGAGDKNDDPNPLDPSQQSQYLMFATGPQENDIITEFMELQKGLGYTVQPTPSTKASLRGHDEVFIRIDLLGVHICQNESKDSLIIEFPMEEIIKYSHNMGKQRFSFCHMNASGLLREYKFCNEKFFEIFEAIGRAIAIIIKIKNKRLREGRTALASQNNDRLGSVQSLPDSVESSIPERKRENYEKSIGTRRMSHGPEGSNSSSIGSMRGSRSMEKLNSSETVDSTADVAQKAALAKLYIEARYHTSAGRLGPKADSASDASAMSSRTSPAEQRRWKNQPRYDYASISQSRSRSDGSLLLEDEPDERRHSVPLRDANDSLVTMPIHITHPSLPRDSVSSVRSIRSLLPSTKNGAATSAAPTKKGRSSVLALFSSGSRDLGKESVKESLNDLRKESKDSLLTEPIKGSRQGSFTMPRQRAETEPIKGLASVHRPSYPEIPSELAGEIKDGRYDSLSRIKKKMGMSTVKQRKGGMGMSPSTSEILTSGESLAEYVPAVVKTQDVNGNEVLIRNQRQNAYEISAGTPDALIEALVDSGAPDLVYLDTFLITYRHFYTPDQVVEKLQECYQRQMEGKPLLGGIGTPSSVMNGIVSFLKKWVGAYPVDFSDTKTKKALNDFLGVIAGGEYASYGKQIQNIFAHEMAAIEIAQRQAPAEEFANMTRNPKELAVLLRDFDIFSQSSKKIAQQLTLVDFKLFRAIRSEEFALTLWGDKQKDWRTVRLRAYIDRFNRVGYWVATVVLSFQEARKRSDAVETFIKIANRCMEMQNFNTAMAIHSGLNTGPVSRLKKTFAGLSSRATAALADIENKLSYRGNYKLYRELENESKPPLLPFFGLVIKDLTFLNDGNQKTLPNGLINFEKQRMIWGIISHIRELQRHKFPFTQEDDVIVHSKTPLVASITLYSYCTNPPCLAEDQLMALSKILEPSDRDRERQKSVSGAAGRSSPGRGSPKSLSRAASRSPSCDALMDILEGNHPKGVPKLIIPAPLGAMTAEILASAPLSSSTIPSDNEGRDSAQDSGSGTNGNNSMEIQHTPSRPQTPPMMRLPSDVRGFLGGSPASPIEPHSPVLERSPKAAQRGRESLADRRMSMAGGTLRRKLSEAGLSAVLGWWKKEEAGDSSSDAG